MARAVSSAGAIVGKESPKGTHTLLTVAPDGMELAFSEKRAHQRQREGERQEGKQGGGEVV